MRMLIYVWGIVVPFQLYIYGVHTWEYNLKTLAVICAKSTVNYGPAFVVAQKFYGLIHLEGHAAWRGGLCKPHCWFLERSGEWFWVPMQGSFPEAPRTFHVCMHHKYCNNLDDLTCTLYYDRASRSDFFLKFLPRMHIFRSLGFGMLYHFYLQKSWNNLRRQLRAMMWVYAQFVFVGIVQPQWMPVIHMFAMQLVYTFFYFVHEWGMHAFIDPLDSNTPFLEQNTTVLLDNDLHGEAYHLSHHSMNTTYACKDKVKEKKHFDKVMNTGRHGRQFNCFKDLKYIQLFRLLMKRDYDGLAKHLVLSKNVELTHEEKVDLVKRRTRKFDYTAYSQEFLESRGFYGPCMHVE